MKLTPNRRMAIFLQNAKPNQDPDGILPLSIWLENLYTELHTTYPEQYPVRLTLNEERVIWEKIITESQVGQSLLKPDSTARLVQEASMLTVQWRLPSFEGTRETEDMKAYRVWAAQYQVLCAHQHWVDAATFVDILIAAIQNRKIMLPKEIILIGFEELTPQLTYFFDCIANVGVIIKTLSLVSYQNLSRRIAAVDTEEEIRLAASMAKKWLDLNHTNTIGIVVPDLEMQRHRVVRLFEAVLAPDTFNVAAPIPLYRYPSIAAVFLALNLLLEKNTIETFSQFLRSPFFGDTEKQQIYRAALDIKIRQSPEYEFTLPHFIQKVRDVLQGMPELLSAEMLRTLETFSQYRFVTQERKSAEEWCVIFSTLLKILKWPGNRPFQVEEHEIALQWQQLLNHYADMGRVLSHHNYEAALYHLTRLAQETVFLPASLHRPVQILGLLEAVGIPFDYLWVTGLHRDYWPLKPMPNPFIPLSLQRENNLPRSSAERELKIAKKFTERLSQGGKEVIFSYPFLVDEHPSTVSALLLHLPEVTKESLQISKNPSPLEPKTTVRFESSWQERGPKVRSTESIKGGARLLALQALCPFRAFAEGRLGALPLSPESSLGLTSRERGEIIHEVLYLFWEGIENQSALHALEEETLQHRIKESIDRVFKTWELKRPQLLTSYYLALEKKRTYLLIERFIQLEKSRPYFEVIAREEEKVVDLQGLKLNIRVDRVDKLANGDQIIIDYKTGEPSLSHWFGERPREPQLPLYCITRTPKPAGIVYGIVRPDAIKFQGVAKEAAIIPGIKTIEAMQSVGAETTWEDQCTSWETRLKLLAKDFIEGVAQVSPLESANPCKSCSLKPLCRIHSCAISVL